MKYCWTTLLVGDLDRSIMFYTESIGLSLNRRFSAGGHGEIAFLGTEETQIELVCPGSESITAGDGITLGFSTDSLEEAMSLMAHNGIRIESGPVQPNEKIRFFYIRDPDGHRVQISQSM